MECGLERGDWWFWLIWFGLNPWTVPASHTVFVGKWLIAALEHFLCMCMCVPLSACTGLCGCLCIMMLLCVCWDPSRWQTSQVSRCWPQAAGSWVAKGVPAAGSHFHLFLRPAHHHLSDLQPRSARITLRQQETAQQQGEFRGGVVCHVQFRIKK